jgi:hypothetical protein
MTPAEAQALEDDAAARGIWLMWFVTYERTGKFLARAGRSMNITRRQPMSVLPCSAAA